MQTCSSCLQSKSTLKNNLRCGVCENLLCKDCVQFLDENFFSFLREIPEDLKHKVYCAPCYDEKVLPVKGSYLDTLEKAKTVYVFEKKNNIPLQQRCKHQVSVEKCPDYKEALLRLAFAAAEQSYNALVEVNMVPEKVYVNGYQSLIWSGTGYPATIFAERLEENRMKKKNEKPEPERITKKKKK